MFFNPTEMVLFDGTLDHNSTQTYEVQGTFFFCYAVSTSIQI